MSERPTMDAIYIRITAVDIEKEEHSRYGKCIWLKIPQFSEAIISHTRKQGQSGPVDIPRAASQATKTRFRISLTVEGRRDLGGVYFVGGYTDNGLVFLDRDKVQDFLIPRRREAISATMAKRAIRTVR